MSDLTWLAVLVGGTIAAIAAVFLIPMMIAAFLQMLPYLLVIAVLYYVLF